MDTALREARGAVAGQCDCQAPLNSLHAATSDVLRPAVGRTPFLRVPGSAA